MNKTFWEAQIKKEKLRIYFLYVIFFISILVGAYVTVHLHFSQVYSVMDGAKILWGRKIIRYGLYILPYIPAIWSTSEIKFREKRIEMQERRKRRC